MYISKRQSWWSSDGSTHPLAGPVQNQNKDDVVIQDEEAAKDVGLHDIALKPIVKGTCERPLFRGQ